MADKPEKKPAPEKKPEPTPEPTPEEKRLNDVAKKIQSIEKDNQLSQLEHSILKAYLDAVEVKGKDIATFKEDLNEDGKKKVAGSIYDALGEHVARRQFGLAKDVYGKLKSAKDKSGTNFLDFVAEQYFGQDRQGLVDEVVKQEKMQPALAFRIAQEVQKSYMGKLIDKPLREAKLGPKDIPAIQKWIQAQPRYEEFKSNEKFGDVSQIYDLNKLLGYYVAMVQTPPKKAA